MVGWVRAYRGGMNERHATTETDEELRSPQLQRIYSNRWLLEEHLEGESRRSRQYGLRGLWTVLLAGVGVGVLVWLALFLVANAVWHLFM